MFIDENEKTRAGDPQFQRNIYETKYFSSKWQISYQLTLTNNTDNPINLQKVDAVMSVSKGTKGCMFHRNSEVSPKQYDDLVKIIDDSSKKDPHQKIFIFFFWKYNLSIIIFYKVNVYDLI